MITILSKNDTSSIWLGFSPKCALVFGLYISLDMVLSLWVHDWHLLLSLANVQHFFQFWPLRNKTLLKYVKPHTQQEHYGQLQVSLSSITLHFCSLSCSQSIRMRELKHKFRALCINHTALVYNGFL